MDNERWQKEGKNIYIKKGKEEKKIIKNDLQR